MIMSAVDLDEPFDLCDGGGKPLGRVKPRGAVHRDGDWHRSLHVWVVLLGAGEPWVVFQKRSLRKDTWPGALDVAVTGHYRAGEGLAQALRESEEEIGLPLGPTDVERLGIRRRADDHAPGIRDHEIQDVMLARTTRALTDLRPAPDEVDALVAVPLEAAALLFERDRDASGLALAVGATAPVPARVTRPEFVDPEGGYYAVALASIAARLAAAPGAEQHAWRLGWSEQE